MDFFSLLRWAVASLTVVTKFSFAILTELCVCFFPYANQYRLFAVCFAVLLYFTSHKNINTHIVSRQFRLYIHIYTRIHVTWMTFMCQVSVWWACVCVYLCICTQYNTLSNLVKTVLLTHAHTSTLTSQQIFVVILLFYLFFFSIIVNCKRLCTTLKQIWKLLILQSKHLICLKYVYCTRKIDKWFDFQKRL